MFSDQTDILNDELLSLKDQMIDNLDRTLGRGTKIELTKERSDSLIQTSLQYSKKSRQVKQAMKRRRMCYIIWSIVAIIVSREIGFV